MQWTDDGLILGVRRHGETSVVLELFTRAHGRHLGLVRGGRSRRLRATLQPGNSVRATWRARLDDHLGAYEIEPLTLRAGRLMERADALHGVAHLGGLMRLIAERDPHEALYETAEVVAEHLDDPDAAPALLVRLELAVLAELGFGLDLASCAATGDTQDLAYVSPRTGRAVGREAGGPYAPKLFALPPFLIAQGPNAAPTSEDVAAGFALTGFFLTSRVWEPRGMEPPDARAAYLASVARLTGTELNAPQRTLPAAVGPAAATRRLAMAFITTATDSESFSFDTREEAVVKAVELVQGGAKGVTVTDEETGEATSGEDLLDAVDDLADGEEPI